MAQSNVSSCVLSIVASFASGLDVFKKFRELRGKKKRPRKNASLDDEEVKLGRSLRQGPEDIGREYQKCVVAVGEHFAHGDVIAQTALAEILLKLNTGLVTVINAFLSRDKKDTKLDYQSLTSLSERSRVDTCRTLRQLYRRLLQRSHVPRHLSTSDDERLSTERRADSKVSESKRRQRRPVASPRHTKVRGPMLARVVIANSSKPGQVAMVRPGERKKKASSASSSKVQSNVSLAQPAPLPSPPPQYSAERPARPTTNRAKTLPQMQETHRNHSVMDLGISQYQAPLPQEPLRTTRSDPRPKSPAHESSLPPMPKTAPLQSASVMEPRRLKKATPTYYSIASNSTKLGEIPLHKWTEPVDFDAMSMLNKEAVRNGWPVTDLDMNQQKRKRGGIFQLFRRGRAEL